MASIRENTSKAGVTTWSVLYRVGSKQSSMTLESREAAESLKQLMDLTSPEKALKLLADGRQAKGITVGELWAQFIEWKAPRLTERIAADYRRDYANWIEPWFAEREAGVVDEGDVQRWVDHMAEQLAPKTVADRHMLMHSMYDWGRARSRRLVEHNPCKETDLPPRGKRKPPKGTTTPEFRALLTAAQRRNPDAADLILFLGETGWRFSEAIALAVRDVTDDGIDVWVDMTRVFRLDAQGRQYIAEDEAKSEAGFRYIRLFPASAAMVRTRLVGKGLGDFVFTNSRGHYWNQNTFLRDTWPRIVADAQLGEGRKPTPHWLRHMHVAVLSAAGVPMQEIQRRIGHEHYSTTVDVYGRRIGDISSESMARAAELMSGKRTAHGISPVVAGELVASAVPGVPVARSTTDR